LVIKLQDERPLERSRRRREDNIKADLKGIGCDGVDWSQLSQDRVQWWAFVDAVMKVLVPYKAGTFLTS